MNTGVYMIEHRESGKKYVGSAAKSFSQRWGQHRRTLRKGTHHSSYLQSAWNKYGEDSFVFRIVKRTSPEEAVDSEQAFIDLYQACDRKCGYNLAPIAGSSLGIKRTAETREKHSCRKASAETRAKMSAARKLQQPASAETRAKISAAGMGRKVSAETRAKMSAAHMGRKFTAERCANMSATAMGKTPTAETRAKMSAAQKLRKPHTAEARTKMSLAAKKYWAIRKTE